MKTELVQTLTTTFEAHAQQTEGGIEYWLARDLQYLLGYDEWRNFTAVITKAKTACEVSGHAVSDHFVDVNKTIEMPKSAEKEIPDLMLTRYACYLIAQNGDPRKQEIAFAQTYFAIQTRRAELIEQRLLEAERVSARRKLSSTEKELSQVIYEQTGGNEDFALIRSHAGSQRQRRGFIPAWGNAPGLRPSNLSRANGPAHSGDDPVRHKTFGVGDGAGLQPSIRFAIHSWGVAPGWYRVAPLVLGNARDPQPRTNHRRPHPLPLGEDRGEGSAAAAECGGDFGGVKSMRISSLIASVPVRSTNGAVSYQPGATPQVNGRPSHPGLKARPIAGGCGSERGLAPSGWDGPSALHFVFPIIPGALPQAGMRSHLWCWGSGLDGQSEQTLAGLLLSRWEMTERAHRTAMNMAEILEA